MGENETWRQESKENTLTAYTFRWKCRPKIMEKKGKAVTITEGNQNESRRRKDKRNIKERKT